MPRWPLLLGLLLAVAHLCTALDSEHEIKLAVLLTRHGDRTPTKLFPNCKSQWPEGLGQMTALGLRQMFDLGTRLRERYIDQFHLLSASFLTDELFVRSTSKDRTLMSAHAFMQGLYPAGTGPKVSSKTYALPGGAQAVPIHAADTHQDHLLYAYKACPRLKLLKKAIHASPAWVQMEEANQELLANMSTLFGAPLRLKDLTNIAVLLQQERTHNQPSLHIPSHTVSKLNTVTEDLFGKKFPTREMGRLAGGNLLADIAYPERFERFKKKPDPSDPTDIYKKEKGDPRFVYYSGHDGTILALFSAMGAHAFRGPQFASHVLLELHMTKEGEYMVAMEYDGVDVQIPGCSEECSLDDFIGVMEEGISDYWAAECNNLNVEVPLPKEPRVRHEQPPAFIDSVLALLAPLYHMPLMLLLVTYGSGLATGLLFVLRAYGRGKRKHKAE